MQFTKIENLDEFWELVKDEKEVTRTEKDWYTVIGYAFQSNDTFSLVDDLVGHNEKETMRAKLECRGLIFDKDGKLISRPFQKFFNLGEKCNGDVNKYIDKPHVLLEKLDGSMVRPFMVGEHMRLGTKAGVTDVSMEAENLFVQRVHYRMFCEFCLKDGITPIFEFTSPDNRIVMEYNEPKLTLLAMRYNDTGDYVNRADLARIAKVYAIDVVKIVDPIRNPEDVIALRDRTDIEGVVIVTQEGEYIKIKTDDYIKRHRYNDLRNNKWRVYNMFFENVMDDVLPTLHDDDRKSIKATMNNIVRDIDSSIEFLEKHCDEIKDVHGDDRRGCYEELSKLPNASHKICMGYMFGGTPIVESFVKHCEMFCLTRKSVNEKLIPILEIGDPPHLVMMVGLPCSGKSTYVNNNFKTGFTIISSDNHIELFAMSVNKTYDDVWQSRIGIASKQVKRDLDKAFVEREQIVIDMTNRTVASRAHTLKRAMELGYFVRLVEFSTSDEELDKRNNAREGKYILLDAMMHMKKEFESVQPNEPCHKYELIQN